MNFFALVKATVILQYHHISDSTPAITSLSPKLFEQHLEYLKTNNFTVLSMEQLLKAIKTKSSLPDKSVVITFDDGYRSIYDTAFPLLKRYNFPFTVFVQTAPLEKELNQFMSWTELEELIADGGSIGNHSVNHDHLIPKSGNSSKKRLERHIEYEISQAQTLLSANLSKVVKVFAYPYGEFSQSTKKVVKRLGYVGLGQHSGAVSWQSDIQVLSRFPMGGRYGQMDDFSLKVNSLAFQNVQTRLLDQRLNRGISHLLPRHQKRPRLQITYLENGNEIIPLNSIRCYASDGSELVKENESESSVIFTLKNDVIEGRSRFNCTAPSGQKNRFYWLSQPLILVDRDGEYY
jgi:peptidoglycan/xylan/chitin deacetylase (PgdA/CDA1 family)